MYGQVKMYRKISNTNVKCVIFCGTKQSVFGSLLILFKQSYTVVVPDVIFSHVKLLKQITSHFGATSDAEITHLNFNKLLG